MHDRLAFISLMEYHNRGSWGALETWQIGCQVEMEKKNPQRNRATRKFSLHNIFKGKPKLTAG